ncbi:MAG: hypothetical protein JJU30_14375 [Alkalimonas sp.]|nr:hypothetical protein [Alkalimonas sp.]
MQTRTLISSLIALLGIWLLLRQAPDFASSMYIVLTETEHVPPSILKLHAMHLSVNFLIGVFLILLRDKLAGWLAPNESGVKVFFRLFLAVGTSLMGVYFIAQGVVSLGESLGNKDLNFGENPYLYWRGIFSLIVGVILFIGSASISRLWALFIRLRHAGV